MAIRTLILLAALFLTVTTEGALLYNEAFACIAGIEQVPAGSTPSTNLRK